MSLPGADVRTALLLKSEICPIGRFEDYKKLVSWAGLAPRVHQSGMLSGMVRLLNMGRVF